MLTKGPGRRNSSTPAGKGATPSRRHAGRAGVGLQVSKFACAALADADQALGLTYWFDTELEGDPYTVRVRFTGRRIGVKGRPGRRDSFEVVETVERVVPGSGPVAVTVRAHDVAPGQWHVNAAATSDSGTGVPGRLAKSRPTRRLSSASSSGATAFAPVVRILAPGARLGAWPVLVGIGVVVALAVQHVLARRIGLPPTRLLFLSVLASVVGAVGAKVYYLVEHRDRRPPLLRAGLCIQGFVLAAIGALAAGTLLLDMPLGRVLDVSTPGLLLGMAIGRLGCFFGGCCAGRSTGSRWALWSSDRRLGVRRVPTQLMEAAIALAVGLAALLAALAVVASGGAVFVASIAAYTLGRQLLFPLRDLPRHSAHGRRLTMAVAAAAVIVAVAAGIVG